MPALARNFLIYLMSGPAAGGLQASAGARKDWQAGKYRGLSNPLARAHRGPREHFVRYPSEASEISGGKAAIMDLTATHS